MSSIFTDVASSLTLTCSTLHPQKIIRKIGVDLLEKQQELDQRITEQTKLEFLDQI